MSVVRQFYSGKNIFITGATGLIGKSTVEKLLRACPDVGSIYILMRGKTGSFEERKALYFSNIIFDKIRQMNDLLFSKVVVMEGDMSLDGLGLSETDRRIIIENTHIVFHCAANVKFDEEYGNIINTNLRGSRRVVELSVDMKQIQAFVFVSTAYSQPPHKILEESHQFPPIDICMAEKFAEHIDDDILRILTPKLLGQYPNTYGYSKACAEHMVYLYKDKLPIAIARPSIVTSAYKDPFCGWTEGLQSINGWAVAVGHGILRSMLAIDHCPLNLVPVDVVVNGMILIAHQRSLTTKKDPLFYNIADGLENPITLQEHIENAIIAYPTYPYDMALWKPGGSIKTNKLHHLVSDIFVHYLPAVLIDLILLLLGQKRFMIRIQNKIHSLISLLNHYINNLYLFRTKNFQFLKKFVTPLDNELFPTNYALIVNREYVLNSTYGARKYLMKQKDENLPKAKRHHKLLQVMDMVVKCAAAFYISKYLWIGLTSIVTALKQIQF